MHVVACCRGIGIVFIIPLHLSKQFALYAHALHPPAWKSTSMNKKVILHFIGLTQIYVGHAITIPGIMIILTLL